MLVHNITINKEFKYQNYFKLHRSNKKIKIKCGTTDNLIKTTNGLIVRRGEKGNWDDTGIGTPIVLCFVGDNEQRWYMWYTGTNKRKPDIENIIPICGSIGLMTSSDGIHWTRPFIESEKSERGENLILEPDKDQRWAFDTENLIVSDVQLLTNRPTSGNGEGVYWMFYYGSNLEETSIPENMPLNSEIKNKNLAGILTRPGIAMSQNGYHWARIEGRHYTNALFGKDDIDINEDIEWDDLFISCPKIINNGPNDMRMYYHSFDKKDGKYKIGLATSPNGFDWIKKGIIFTGSNELNKFDEKGTTSHHIVYDEDNRQYVMFYEGIDKENKRSIGLAISKDGIFNWKICPNVILKPNEKDKGAWDHDSVGCPWAIAMKANKWRLYYAAKNSRNSCWEGIGLALSAKDSEIFFNIPIEFIRKTLNS